MSTKKTIKKSTKKTISKAKSAKKIYPKKLSEQELTQLCHDCEGRCCLYFCLEIDTPDSKYEFEKLRWYLTHQKTWIYVSDDKWHLMVHNPCNFFDRDHKLCKIYEKRPTICREHKHNNCERDNDVFYDQIFMSLEELDQYISKLKNLRK